VNRHPSPSEAAAAAANVNQLPSYTAPTRTLQLFPEHKVHIYLDRCSHFSRLNAWLTCCAHKAHRPPAAVLGSSMKYMCFYFFFGLSNARRIEFNAHVNIELLKLCS